MGVSVDSPSQKGSWDFLKFLTRRKQVDSPRRNSQPLLAKELTVLHLIAVGVGSTIGAGVYVLVGAVAREHAGPALAISFLIAGLAAGLSAFCYAELASRCPSAGSAYHYTYICLGEGVAWLIGWSLLLEYTIGSAAVARGVTPNLAALFGGADNLPIFLARQHIRGIDIVVDPCAAILVLLVTGLLCVGIKESTVVQGIVTAVNVCALLFVIAAGGYLGFKSGWVGYELPIGFFPFGINGMLAGSATVFFAYIGFDAVASTAEEVKNPQRDLPLGIGGALFICCGIYMMVSIVVVGLVPYYAIDPDTPISSAFANQGMEWAAYIINAGAFTALCSALLGGILPQPRILMSMARDGLLPPFFCDINKQTQVPVKGTIATGVVASFLAFSMEVSQLAGMVSVGTLLAFTMVAISVLILRYIPPDEVPLPPSLQDSIASVLKRYRLSNAETNVEYADANVVSSEYRKPLIIKEDVSIDFPKHLAVGNHLNEGDKRRVVGWIIAFICLGEFVLIYATSDFTLLSSVRFALCGIGGATLLCGFVLLTCIDQDDARHDFGHSGGFICPFVPLLPIACILINSYLLVNLGDGTWFRVSIWLATGLLVYVFYGRTHSSLKDAIYVPAKQVDEIYQNYRSCLA
ncbi:hypothetical protein AAZX31_19G104500 [Glycine max]|uniref:Cationic amino acid transporter C-terminal domain-containing protein n=1 Tax=Glycine max TaxID=3847 RepID=I1N8D4_SOYBN|nr:cationic amino acid transporter 2, vacuolar [Glycine max]KAG4912752.1 hypothetical protein JHK86_053185 [Glycine max]KAG4927579.1 hypothetical protein JHK85_054065 [Glycine max]KAH1077397.1 hypothetical protein GYH30_052767 [Glycine max]KAH1194414.1 Cationic amino acid transporter 2, vacuolar [Glycine max]KRG94899.1 hypothetical protein GLYMA_19G116500v4 [Glycine max]|eukprot:XP_006604261.1 cationic amino acid transporter 2, vacuolar [Glycine max]